MPMLRVVTFHIYAFYLTISYAHRLRNYRDICAVATSICAQDSRHDIRPCAPAYLAYMPLSAGGRRFSIAGQGHGI